MATLDTQIAAGTADICPTAAELQTSERSRLNTEAVITGSESDASFECRALPGKSPGSNLGCCLTACHIPAAYVRPTAMTLQVM